VALESTIISHGMPYPQNVATALQVEGEVRAHGAVPATMAVVDGRLKAGLSRAEIEALGRAGSAVPKLSRRDLPLAVAAGQTGATTVAATMIIAALAGIRVFATGGIGGVHRGAGESFDISADLLELARTPVAVVCAGVKSILDIRLTLEVLETHGVPVVGYGTDRLPAFFARDSGFGVDARLDTPAQMARALQAQWAMGLRGGMVIANPVPEAHALPREVIDAAIAPGRAAARRSAVARWRCAPGPACGPSLRPACLEHQPVGGMVAAEHRAFEFQCLQQLLHLGEQRGLLQRLPFGKLGAKASSHPAENSPPAWPETRAAWRWPAGPSSACCCA
jgi:pseudouridine-5'-phosphate glycosidase